MEIYLAGAETIQMSRTLHQLRYPYRLCSYFHIGKKRPDELMEHAKDGSKWIMDSGLFSMMFGAHKNKLTTYDDFREYAQHYVQTMHDWGWEHTIVECDTQRLLGVEETYRLREEVFERCGLEVIYVWHIPCGTEALVGDAYMSRDRIALSVPEIRDVCGGGAKTKAALIKLLSMSYRKGPKVHLLGNTEMDLLSLEADSCDSTSWLAGVRYGRGAIYGSRRIQAVSIYSPKYRKWLEWCESVEPDVYQWCQKQPDIERHRRLAASIISYRMMAQNTHGDHPWL